MPDNNSIVERELELQKFWEDNKIFQKTLEATKNGPVFNFYDGPPFASGTAHYGHLVGSAMKDVVPRYWTMKGYSVERKWGWDCHGLPIENIVEKELGFKNKKDIIDYGIDKFNETCRSKVLTYVEEWKKTISRFGRWADMDNPYKTMDMEYMESVWWVFKELYDKGLVYEGYKSMHVCPRCETTLSQMEVSEGYRDIEDLTTTWKFPVVGQPDTYLLAWTTVPWSTLSTMGLAIGPDFTYVKVKINNENIIFIKDQLEKIMDGKSDYEVVEEFKGSKMVGWEYEPLVDFYKNLPEVKNSKNVYHVLATDYVEAGEGTGIVTINGSYGEIDLATAQQYELPVVMDVKMDGRLADIAKDYAGMYVKDGQKNFIADMEKKNLVWNTEKYTHSYPHCWRCDTPLLNYSTSSWFVKVTEIKDKALKLAKDINWSPEHIKEGRFGKWLEGARDWSISRQRFWASVIPIWKCECGEMIVYGSAKDLEKDSGAKITDLHKHFVDKIEVPCKKCKGVMHRLPDVLDTWFDSGSMPYAQNHYPFENKKKFDDSFPAQFIAEGVDQCRAWFYYLHVIATSIKDSRAFSNVIVNGIVLAEDGKKMAKKLHNYPEPEIVMEKYGADALRYYLLSSPVMSAENMNFSEAGVKEAMQKVIMLTNNILNFYKLYEDASASPLLTKEGVRGRLKADNILDQWLLSKLNLLIQEITKQMEAYDLPRSVRPIQEFIDEFSTWWLRRSRDRFKGSASAKATADKDDEKDKEQALAVFKHTLTELSKLMAPFTPFIADYLYKQIGGGLESVHLEKWPEADEKKIDQKVLDQMESAKKIVEMGLAVRAEKGIKIRQPLSKLTVYGFNLEKEFSSIIADEINVKSVEFAKGAEIKVELDTNITEELQIEGMLRELIRTVNNIRKNQGLTPGDMIELSWQSEGEVVNKLFGDKKLVAELQKSTITQKLSQEDVDGPEIKINNESIKLKVKKL